MEKAITSQSNKETVELKGAANVSEKNPKPKLSPEKHFSRRYKILL